MVDATIIHAPSSTKNKEKARDPEMHQTRKGKQWYFGMKMHIGADSQSKLIHSVVVTPANVHDKHPLPQLLHGNERRVYADAGYAGQQHLIRTVAPNAKAFINERRPSACSPKVGRPPSPICASLPSLNPERLGRRDGRFERLARRLGHRTGEYTARSDRSTPEVAT
jgi:hypothetical protein